LAFIDDEKSVSASAPVELITITLPTTVFRYTNYDSDYVFGGNTYLAITGLRSSVTCTSTGSVQEVVLEMPVSTPFVRQHALASPLPAEMFVEIRRVQGVSGQSRIVWDGKIASVRTEGRMASLRIPSLMEEAIATQIPSVHFQVLCNHPLYSPRCGILRQTQGFDFTPTVLSASGLTVTVSSIFSKPDGWFDAGEIIRTSDGERRAVLSQVGTVLTLEHPFSSAPFPFATTLMTGCNKSVLTCRDKFNNVINFGGFPNISSDFVLLSRIMEVIRDAGR